VHKDNAFILCTFLSKASIDQRNEKLGMSNACNGIALVVDKWLVQNPTKVTLKIILDNLIRKDCQEYKKTYTKVLQKYHDSLLDLQMVVQKSKLAFSLHELLAHILLPRFSQTIENFSYLQVFLLFQYDTIAHESTIYIASWNKYFFFFQG